VIQTCPSCFSADDVTYERLPDGVVAYTCDGNHHGSGAHQWVALLANARIVDEAAAGVTDELLEPFSQCVYPDEPFMEYGIIELRFREGYPELFRSHVADRGHRMLSGRVKGDPSASGARFGMALSRLRQKGEVANLDAPATGAWAPQEITYWARTPADPATTPKVTWSEWCAENGRPDTWTAEDLAAAGR
jgi:hypothetical protein